MYNKAPYQCLILVCVLLAHNRQLDNLVSPLLSFFHLNVPLASCINTDIYVTAKLTGSE